MLTATTLTTILQFLNQPDTFLATADAFDPVSAEVSIDADHTLEILVFDDDGRMDGALLISADPAAGVRLEASFADGYAMATISDHDPSSTLAPSGMISLLELQRRCGYSEGPSPELDVWWATDLPDPCAAAERVETMLALAHDPIVALGEPLGDKPSKRECIWRFAISGSVCVATIAAPGLAGTCAVSTVMNLCACAQHLGIKNYCNWD